MGPPMLDTKEKTRNDLGLLLLSVICPPLGVALAFGLEKEFALNVVLTLLGYVPGVIHACWILNKPPIEKIESAMKIK